MISKNGCFWPNDLAVYLILFFLVLDNNVDGAYRPAQKSLCTVLNSFYLRSKDTKMELVISLLLFANLSNDRLEIDTSLRSI